MAWIYGAGIAATRGASVAAPPLALVPQALVTLPWCSSAVERRHLRGDDLAEQFRDLALWSALPVAEPQGEPGLAVDVACHRVESSQDGRLACRSSWSRRGTRVARAVGLAHEKRRGPGLIRTASRGLRLPPGALQALTAPRDHDNLR